MGFIPSFSFSLSLILIAAPGALEEQGAGVHDNNLGDDYQRVELPVLYYHSKTGYYYDPVSFILVEY